MTTLFQLNRLPILITITVTQKTRVLMLRRPIFDDCSSHMGSRSHDIEEIAIPDNYCSHIGDWSCDVKETAIFDDY